jgi:hypothetical protein
VASVELYLDGVLDTVTTEARPRFELVTDSLLDGVHWLEARAQDEYGNLGVSPILRINVANSIAQGPRLIWVPDEFARIQDAINSAIDFDTIRVRDGTYYETLNLFGKGIWLESEHGPTRSILNGIGSNSTITFTPGANKCVIRGFGIGGANVILRADNGSKFDVQNNIVSQDTGWTCWLSAYTLCEISNNLFRGGSAVVQLGYAWGTFYNNMVLDGSEYGFWDAAVYTNPVEYGFNLFWNNLQDYAFFEEGAGDLHEDPLIDWENGRLRFESPARNAGNPNITDKDSTRSDIGPFGGPLAY